MKRILFFYKKNFFKFLTLMIGLWLAGFFFKQSAQATKEDDKAHICFFELGNTRTSDNFINKNTPDTVVHRYQIQKGEKGRTAFERMVKAGHKCDSLVVSGHHTGDWFGKTGTLWLKDMETLSCKKEYQNWFQNIKALWLDGCNTVTDKFIESSQTADSETVRVVGKEDKKTALNANRMRVYQQSYAGSLDENTSLSSRYLRMFPETQIYGFNGPAPLVDSNTEKDQVRESSFIFNHLTNLGEALSAEAHLKDIKTDFERGLKALFSDDPCDKKKIKAWEEATSLAISEAVEHQDYKKYKKAYKKAYKLGCDLILAKQVLDNPKSTEAQKALANKIIQDKKEIIQDTEEAKKILKDSESTKAQKDLAKKTIQNNKKILALANTVLNKPNSKEAIELAKLSVVKTLKAINEADQNVKDKKYSHLLFNNIYDTWNTAKKYQTKDSEFFGDVKTEFQQDSFSNSLKERIQSPYTASLKKGDYIKFYTEVHDVNINKNDDKAVFVKKYIGELLNKAGELFPDLKSPRQSKLDLDTKRVLAVSVADQLLQYDLLSKDQIENLIENKELFPGNTKNFFIMQTQTELKNVPTELKFKGKKPKQIIDSIKGQTKHSLEKRSEIQIGAKILLNQGDKKSLSRLANSVVMDGDIVPSTDGYAFYTALYNHLKGETDEEKVNILFDLSKKTEGYSNLEMLVLGYANCNLSDDLSKQNILRQKFYNKMQKERTHRYGSLLKASCKKP